MWDWVDSSLVEMVMVVASTLVFYTAVIVATRLRGLRSFAKLSAYDFVMTLAVGSLLASTIVAKDPPLLLALTALTTIYVMQYVASVARRRWKWLEDLTSNDPLLLMEDGEFLEENMRDAHITHDELYAKLREANVTHLSQVRAVVLETTGDMNVLHGEELQRDLLTGVSQGRAKEGQASSGTLRKKLAT